MEPDYNSIKNKLNEIDKKVSSLNHSDYSYIRENLKKLLWYNFLIGITRGFGMAVGFTVLGALVVYTLQRIVLLNLPGISRFIAEIIKLVQSHYMQ